MTCRETLKRDIDLLPDEALDDLQRYIFMQKFYFAAFSDDTEYLSSIPGMTAKIVAAMGEPLADSIPADRVNW